MNKNITGWIFWGAISIVTGVGGYFLGQYLKKKSEQKSYNEGYEAGRQKAHKEYAPQLKEMALKLKESIGGLQSAEFVMYLTNLDMDNIDMDEFTSMLKLEESAWEELQSK